MEMEVVLQEQVSSTLCPVGSQSDPKGSKAIKDVRWLLAREDGSRRTGLHACATVS
jgi:hypothetical protein